MTSELRERVLLRAVRALLIAQLHEPDYVRPKRIEKDLREHIREVDWVLDQGVNPEVNQEVRDEF